MIKEKKGNFLLGFLLLMLLSVLFSKYLMLGVSSGNISSEDISNSVNSIYGLVGTIALALSNYVVMGLELIVIVYVLFQKKYSSSLRFDVVFWVLVLFGIGIFINIKLLS